MIYKHRSPYAEEVPLPHTFPDQSLADYFLGVGGATVAVMVLAGVFSSVLIAIAFAFGVRVRQNRTVVGLAVATSVPLAAWFISRGIRLIDEEYAEDRRRHASEVVALFDGVILKGIHRISLVGVVKGWYITDLEDFGPGFVVETDCQEYVFLCGWILDEISTDENGNTWASSEIELWVDGVTLELKECKFRGDRIPVTEQFSIRELPISTSSGFVILSAESRSIPPSSTSKINSGKDLDHGDGI